MKCKNCGAEVDKDAEFCSECGARIAKGKIICPYCNAEISDGKFCSHCGRRLDGSDAPKEQLKSGLSDDINGDIFADIDDFGISGAEDSKASEGNFDYERMARLSGQRVSEKNDYDKKDALSKALTDFKYITQSNGDIIITGVVNNDIIKAIIPEGVVSIADDAFKDSELVMVELPKSIIKIGDRAFMGCKDLSSINFPEKLTLVGDEAFADCSSLDIEFPKTIKNIGKDALKGTIAYNREIKEQEDRKRKAEEERKRKEEEERKRKAEEERRRKEAEERKAEEERKRKEEEERKRICVGSTIKFGNYHGATEWIILAKDEKKILIIAKDIIDSIPYNKQNVGITWEKCTLRKWLNNEYIDIAFSAEEKNKILTTHVVNNDNPSYKTKGGNDTEDKVFLLSIEEADMYFKNKVARMAKGTEYAKENDLWVSSSGSDRGYSYWWLRSPGLYSSSATYVDYDGDLDNDGVDWTSCGVRPALWIRNQ